ncbi:MAG TPA: GNAT family N-acetyltransferase [Candidatus Nanoarchaeia archaeon]|nr:GNAT family N-acetyltransferase [Candidatus Nanoarchaeia archaeon]
MKLRLLRKGDILSCSKIVGENYSKKYEKNSTKEMKEMFSKSLIKPRYIVAEKNYEILGFGGYTQSFMDYHVYQIFWINVKPNFQNKGIGTKIVKRIIEDIKKTNVEGKKPLLIQLTTTNPNFYKKIFNFKTIAILKEGHHLMSLFI